MRAGTAFQPCKHSTRSMHSTHSTHSTQLSSSVPKIYWLHSYLYLLFPGIKEYEVSYSSRLTLPSVVVTLILLTSSSMMAVTPPYIPYFSCDFYLCLLSTHIEVGIFHPSIYNHVVFLKMPYPELYISFQLPSKEWCTVILWCPKGIGSRIPCGYKSP